MDTWILIGKVMNKNRIDRYVFESNTNMTKLLTRSEALELMKKNNVINAKRNGSTITCTWFSNNLLPTYKIVNSEPVQIKGMTKEEIYAMANKRNDSEKLEQADTNEDNNNTKDSSSKGSKDKRVSNTDNIKTSNKNRKTPADIVYSIYEWFKRIVYR